MDFDKFKSNVEAWAEARNCEGRCVMNSFWQMWAASMVFAFAAAKLAGLASFLMFLISMILTIRVVQIERKRRNMGIVEKLVADGILTRDRDDE